MSSAPTLWLIAGPNGVGKTTYAFRHVRAVSGSVNFVNLDEIARGLSPLDPSAAQQAAARVALARTREFIRYRISFTIETTLAGRTHLRTLEAATKAGMQVRLLLFFVRTPEICLARIARRVAEGGHNVAEADVRRRFSRAIVNFKAYADRSDIWTVLDNSRAAPTTAAEGRRGCLAVERDVSELPADLIKALRSLPACSEE